jgi:hypothetical protein
MKKLVLLAAVALFAGSVYADSYKILNTSTLNDVRKVGGQNIPEISLYSSCLAPSTCSGTLNPLNPADWPLMDRDITTWPDYTDINNPTGIEANNINVDGTITLGVGGVTAAVINQLDPLSYATFQSTTATNNLVSGDPSITNCDHISGASANLKCVPSNPIVWTYNSVTNQLNHQAGGGTALTSASIGTCVLILGGGATGQCRQLAAAIDASGELAQTTITHSQWNWNGMAANYIVRDSSTTPWHTATGNSTAGGLQISGAGGQPGVVWDFSGFTPGVGGVITARTVADVLTGNSATGISGLYTLNLVPAPVPAAVWLFGSAVALLAWLRRRVTAA